jgi:hypothetical protein
VSAAEIQSLIVAQKMCVDRRDAAGLREVYAPDFHLSVSFHGQPPTVTRGRDEVIAMMSAGWATLGQDGRPPAHLHFLAPAAIRPDGDRSARAHHTELYIDLVTGATVGWGQYDDEVVLTEAGWRLSRREVQAHFVSSEETA